MSLWLRIRFNEARWCLKGTISTVMIGVSQRSHRHQADSEYGC